MAQQTAVEWLVEQMEKDSYQIIFGKLNASIETIEQAKAMEKSTIMAAYMRGSADTIKLINLELVTIAEEYYNETHESNNRI